MLAVLQMARGRLNVTMFPCYPTLQLWEEKPNSQALPHPLLRVFCSPASAQGQSGAPSRLQTATQHTRKTTEGHQVGDSKGESWVNTGRPGASSTRLRLFPQPTTELDYDLGTAGNNNL